MLEKEAILGKNFFFSFTLVILVSIVSFYPSHCIVNPSVFWETFTLWFCPYLFPLLSFWPKWSPLMNCASSFLNRHSPTTLATWQSRLNMTDKSVQQYGSHLWLKPSHAFPMYLELHLRPWQDLEGSINNVFSLHPLCLRTHLLLLGDSAWLRGPPKAGGANSQFWFCFCFYFAYQSLSENNISTEY